jgi:hypothetical protein
MEDSLERLAELESEALDAGADVSEELEAGAEVEDGSFEVEAGGVVEGAGLGVVDAGGVELVEGTGVGEGEVVGSGVVVGLGLDVVLPESLDEAPELAPEPEADCLFLRGIVKLRCCAGVGELGSNTSRMDIYKGTEQDSKSLQGCGRATISTPVRHQTSNHGIARPILARHGQIIGSGQQKGTWR